MTMIDIGCWERGCACYDSRIKDDTVEVVRRDWVDLTHAEIGAIFRAGWANNMDFAEAIQKALREKNT